MLHIILLILKIIGIILLCILGFLLLAGLIVLLVPIRYDAEMAFYSRLNGRARIHWILHIISANIIITDNKARVLIRIFGFPFIDSAKPKKKKRKKKPSGSIEGSAEELPDSGESVLPEETGGLELPEAVSEQAEATESQDEPAAQSPDKSDIAMEHGEEPEEAEKISVWERLKQKILAVKQKVLNIWKIITDIFTKIKFIFLSVCDKIKTGKLKLSQLKELWEEPKNQKSLALIKEQTVGIIRHIRPRKVHVFLHYGLDDPAVTGEILGWLAVLMAFYQDSVRIQPDFQQAVFEGEIELKGRIRIGRFALAGIRLLMDSNLRALVKKLI